MAVKIKIVQRNGPSATMRQLREAELLAMALVAKAWHDKYLPGHFTIAGGKRYNYQPRKGDNEPAMIPNPGYGPNRALGFNAPRMLQNWNYSWRKRRVKRHNKPLVWSGRSEEMAKAAVKVTTRRRAGLVQASAAMQLPAYFYQYLLPGFHDRRVNRYDAKGKRYVHRVTRVYIAHEMPDKYDELTRVIPAEEAELTAVASAAVARMLAAQSENETVAV